MNFQTDSVAAIAERVRRGEQSAREIAESCLSRIEALQPHINAFVAVHADHALSQADAVDAVVGAGDDPGPLADRKSTRLNSSHTDISRMPSSA